MLQLSEEEVNQLRNAKNPTLTFSSSSAGCISISEQHELPFTTRTVSGANDGMARGVLFSRRGDAVRNVGPIIADMDVERNMPTHRKRKHPHHAGVTPAARPRLPSMPEPPAPGQPIKGSQPLSKRPRPARPSMPRTAPVSPNVRPPTHPLLPGEVASVGADRAVLSGGPRNPRAKLRSIRSPVSPPGTSPGHGGPMRLSNGRGLSGGLTSRRPNAVANGSGTSPDDVGLPLLASNPRYPRRTSPESPARDSAAARVSAECRERLRRHVIHMAATHSKSIQEVRRRCDVKEGTDEDAALGAILKEVASVKRGVLHLHDVHWDKVSEGYECYDERERGTVRKKRSLYQRVQNGSGDDGDSDSEGGAGMSDGELDAKMREFESEGGDKRVGGEVEMRKAFSKWYPVYDAIVRKMQKMHRDFSTLERRFKESEGRDREAVVKTIRLKHSRQKERRRKLEVTLPKLHGLLKDIKETLRA